MWAYFSIYGILVLFQWRGSVTFPILTIIRVRRALVREHLLFQFSHRNWKSKSSLLERTGGPISALFNFGYFSNTRKMLLFQFCYTSAPIQPRFASAYFSNFTSPILESKLEKSQLTTQAHRWAYLCTTRLRLLLQYQDAITFPILVIIGTGTAAIRERLLFQFYFSNSRT